MYVINKSINVITALSRSFDYNYCDSGDSDESKWWLKWLSFSDELSVMIVIAITIKTVTISLMMRVINMMMRWLSNNNDNNDKE